MDRISPRPQSRLLWHWPVLTTLLTAGMLLLISKMLDQNIGRWYDMGAVFAGAVLFGGFPVYVIVYRQRAREDDLVRSALREKRFCLLLRPFSRDDKAVIKRGPPFWRGPLNVGSVICLLCVILLFGAERLGVQAVAGGVIAAIIWSGLKGGTRTGTLEDVIGDEIGRVLAPVIALAGPRDRLLGASRLRVTAGDDDWPGVVAELCMAARAILLIDGSSDGIRQELHILAQNVSPRKLFLFFIPDALKRSVDARWHEQRQLFADCGWFLPAENPGVGSVIAFDDERLGIVIAQNAQTYYDYVAPVANAMGSYYPTEPLPEDGNWGVGI